ncbi:hypothetical protein [Mucilaginibacter sp.]
MKSKTLLYLLLSLFMVQSLTSCTDIIEPSISKYTVKLEAPADQYISPSYTINFWWDQVANALTYHLQVVTLTFASPGSLVLDTVITGNKFSFSLSPGNYQWRVMAENGSSQTPYAGPRSFTVGASSIKQQTVQLSTPANNYLTSSDAIVLTWAALYGATKYQLQIDTNSFADTTHLVYNKVLSGQQFNFNFPKDQVYQWRVRGENDTAYSAWSTTNTMTYDHTPPGQVSVLLPANNQTVPLPVNLQWSSTATANRYKLYVFQSDSTTNYSSLFPMIINTTDYNFNFGTSGDRVYWKVSAVDAAGNEGQASTMRSFVLQ